MESFRPSETKKKKKLIIQKYCLDKMKVKEDTVDLCLTKSVNI